MTHLQAHKNPEIQVPKIMPLLTHQKDRSHTTLITFLKLGCTTRLLPFEWNPKEERLIPANSRNMLVFNLQKNMELAYVIFMWYRLVYFFVSGEFSLLSALWSLSQTNLFFAYVTMAWYPNEVMWFCNRLLGRDFLGKSEVGENVKVNQKIARIEYKCFSNLSVHLSFNTFMLYVNPLLHFYIVYHNTCAPNFISSLFLHCSNSLEDSATLKEKFFFLVFELYNVVKWQYVVSFMWICIFMGTEVVGVNLKKMVVDVT